MKTAEPTPASIPPAPASVPASLGGANAAKVHAAHLERRAVVSVRPATPKQVLENRASTARHSAFADPAVALGWPRERSVTSADDRGKSGRTADGRSGFQRLVTEVTRNPVGLVRGLAMSRWARSSKDWHAFFAMGALFGTLIAADDGVRDGHDPNDRLLLGLKGSRSAMERHSMRHRLERGRDNNARRGALVDGVPRGDVLLPPGELDGAPDAPARAVVHLVFDKVAEGGRMDGVFYGLLPNARRRPLRARTGAPKGPLEWRRPAIPTRAQLLRQPIEAGAYA